MTDASRSQLTGAPARVRHAWGSMTCSIPVVCVAAVNVPLAFNGNVPVTCRLPVTVPEGQVRPNSGCRSSSPDTGRQDDFTVHVPVAVPPHGEKVLVQAAPLPPEPVAPPLPRFPPLPVGPPLPPVWEPPLPVLPPLEVEPPELLEPPLPGGGLLEVALQAPRINPILAAKPTVWGRAADISLISY